MALYLKKNTSNWVAAKNVYVKATTSAWKAAKKIYVKTTNGWAQFWPSAGPSPVYEVDLSTSKSSYPASGTSYPVLTGTTYHWSYPSSFSLSYAFSSSSSPNGPWTNIKTGSYIANPSLGNTTSVTYTPQFTDYPSNPTYFNFAVTASTGGSATRTSNSYTQYSVTVDLPAPIWTTTIPRIGTNSLFATGKIVTWNVGKATIQGSSSSVGYYTTIWKISPTSAVTYLKGTSTTPDFQSTDDYQYTISIPSGDSGYTYYFTTYSAQSLITNPVQSTSYSYNQTVILSPAIVTNPSVTKYDGYQTVGHILQGNTGTWNQNMDDYYYGWQYCNTNSSTVTDWNLMYSYSYNPISGATFWTPYSGTDTAENQNHVLTIPQYTYTLGSSTPISLAGKYINFYSLADKNYISAPVPPLQVVGPIYNAPGNPTSFTVYKGNAYSSSQAYVNFYWTDPASLGGTSTWYKYTVQYNNGGTWTDLGSTYSSTYNGYLVSPLNLLVPVGTWDFRVKNENQEGLAAYSNTYNLQVVSAYNFAFGNVLYPNTNGQIGLDAGSLSVTIPSSGRVLAIYGLDLYQQTTGYYSDGRYFYIQFSGWAYGQTNVSTYALRYQVKFDTLNPNYADVLICNKGSSLSQPTYIGIYSGGSLYAGVQGPFSLATNSSYRIYFDGTTGYTGGASSFTQIPSADFVATSLTAGTADDGYTSITTASNQYTPSYFSGVSGSVASNTLSVSFTGNIDYSYYYYRLDTGSYYGTNFANATGATSNPLTVSNLNAGTTYYLTITPYNSFGQAGTTYQNSYTAPNNPGPFATASGTKGYPSGAVQSASEPSGNRTLSVSWNASSNASYYEVQYEGSDDGVTWNLTPLQTLAGAPYLTTTSDTFSAPYHRYYRYTVRARNAAKDIATAAYSDGGSSSGYVYRYLTGTAPTAPSIGSITYGTTTASIPFTINSGGSNTVDWIQYSTDQVNWTNIYLSPITLSGLSSGTSYTYYVRALNYDGLTSSNSIASFTTTSGPQAFSLVNFYDSSPTPGAVSVNTPTQGSSSSANWIYYTWTAPVVYNYLGTAYTTNTFNSRATGPSGQIGSNPRSVTSDFWVNGITSTGYYYAYVSAVNNIVLQCTANWTASTNATYYRVNYTIAGSTATTSNITDTSWSISSSSAVTINTITAYDNSGNSQVLNVNQSVTPTSKTGSEGSSYAYLTYHVIPTISMGSNTNITTSGATINWTSTNQSYANVNSTYVGNVNSYTFSGLNPSTTYSGTVTVYSSSGDSASGSYSFTTNSAGVKPSDPGKPVGQIVTNTSTSYAINWSWSLSSTGTAPVDYAWVVYSATSSGGTLSQRASGHGTNLTTASTNWNRTTYGSWAVLKVTASNSYGSSNTISSNYT